MSLRRSTLVCERLEARQVLSASSTGLAELVNDPTIGNQTAYSGDAVANLEDGTMVVAYAGRGQGDRDGVFFRRVSAEGALLADPQLVNQTTAGSQTNAAMATLPNGGFVVVWQGRGTGDREGIFARWFDASGAAVSDEVLINQTTGGTQANPRVAVAADGTATFVWEGVGSGDFDGIFARRFGSTGTPQSNEMLVNTTTARQQADADIALREDGSALVTWSSRHQDGSDWGVYAQRLAADGTKQGSEFLVNGETAYSQMRASVEADGAGFVVAWQSRHQDGDGWGIYAQQIAGDGTQGEEFRVNGETNGEQQEASLATNAAGGVVVAWTDGVPDGTGWNVKARALNLAGPTPILADEFFVNSATATPHYGHQRAPNVAATDTAFAIAWSGDGEKDHDGVYLHCVLPAEANLSPDLAPIPDQTAQVGVEMEVMITATDPNVGDTLTYILDTDDSPPGATIEKIDNNNAVIRWTPTADDLPGPVMFRVLVIDDGEPPLADDEEFLVTLSGT